MSRWMIGALPVLGACADLSGAAQVDWPNPDDRGEAREGYEATEFEPLDPIEVEPCKDEPSTLLTQCTTGVAAVAESAPGATATPVTFPTIQSAIDQGATEIAVCPGTHGEALTASGVHLFSASGDPTDTVLTGRGTHRILDIGGPSVVQGFTFEDGWHDYDGGAVVARGGLEIRCSVFRGNYADYQGGAVQARGDLTVVDTTFDDNSADYEGGALSWGDWDDGALQVVGATFSNNRSRYNGGAIIIGTWAFDDVLIEGSTFLNNADPHGEGVVAFGSWGGFDARIDDCHFEGNDEAIGLEGWLRDGYDLQVNHTTIVGDPGNW